MNSTYAQKQAPAQKKDAPIAQTTSINDASANSMTLQCHAKMMNSSTMPIQRKLYYVGFDDYQDAYGPEIAETNTYKALKKLEALKPAGWMSPLAFTDDYRECAVSRDPTTKRISRIKIPHPNPDIKMDSGNAKYLLSAGLDPKKIKRMHAIHELEHLRLFYENSQESLINLESFHGEPSMNPNIISMFVFLKDEICNYLFDAIPKELPENLKAYIKERLLYIRKPKDLNASASSPENATAKELTTVLIELKKFCEFYHNDSLSLFKFRVNEVCARWINIKTESPSASEGVEGVG